MSHCTRPRRGDDGTPRGDLDRGRCRREDNDVDTRQGPGTGPEKTAAQHAGDLLRILKEEMETGIRAGIADAAPPERVSAPVAAPHVIMVVGINGVGKTTTIGKLAQRLKLEGKNVMIAAADTFRAAANEQLAIWATRAGAEIIQQRPGSDPAAVAFDAVQCGASPGMPTS